MAHPACKLNTCKGFSDTVRYITVSSQQIQRQDFNMEPLQLM